MNDHHCRPSRRAVLRASGATILGALAADLLAPTRLATAQPLSGSCRRSIGSRCGS
jgi:hypothetical protein